MVKIFIDPGHGGNDPGATANGLQEKNLTLAIAVKIRDLLSNYENVQVRLSRSDDRTVSLKQRTDMANTWGADYLVSVHINAGGGVGYEDFIYTSASTKSVAYQNVMHAEIIKQLDFVDRGKKRGNLHMVRVSRMPAILTENGFIDNPGDAAKLKQTSYIERIARGHVNGIVSIFRLKAKSQAQTQAQVTQPRVERKLSGMKPNWADWQWEEAADIFRKAREKGIITSDQWEKKAATKNLTFDELEYLNLVLYGRVI